ncbi:unnamed protein product, partial [Mesorhabditis belari]|uniref:Uncharacterized protein n=1 Tax=Mesorhabditis belari TaxID=2138241 RepID=A0AAF3EEM0_9BILA
MINIGLASLLALAITLTVVADNIPRTATVPLIGWFVLICIALCILSVLAGLIFAKIEEFVKKHDHLPVPIDRFMCFYQTKLSKVVTKKPFPPEEIIKTLSFALFLLMQVLLFCNLMVFLSFDWNKRAALENWVKTDDMKVYDELEK